MSAVLIVILVIVFAYVFITSIYAIIEVAAFLFPVGMLAVYGYAGYALYLGKVPPILVPYVVTILGMPVVAFLFLICMRRMMARKHAALD